MGFAHVNFFRANHFMQFKMPGMPERTKRIYQAHRNAKAGFFQTNHRRYLQGHSLPYFLFPGRALFK